MQPRAAHFSTNTTLFRVVGVCFDDENDLHEAYQAFRYALQPTSAQTAMLVRSAGCWHYVHDRAVALQIAVQAVGAPVPDASELINDLATWPNESANGWLRCGPMDVLRLTLLNLHQAHVNRDSLQPEDSATYRHGGRQIAVRGLGLSQTRVSSNWLEQKTRLERIHAPVAHAPQEYFHKLSTELVRRQATVCIEDLRVIGVTRSQSMHSGEGGVENAKRYIGFSPYGYGMSRFTWNYR